MKLLPVLLFFTVALVASVNAATDKIFCYYGSWANYRNGDGQAKIEDINFNLCTHVIYTFVGLSEDGGVKSLDAWLDKDLNALGRITGLKKQNPKLKVLVAIGGWNEGSSKYSRVVANPTSRAKFVDSALEFVKTHNFDGFDLDWEYPAQRGGAKEDKRNFIELIKELRVKFDPHKLLLTAAVGASKHHRDASYDVPQMSKYLDYINVMSYDLHGHGEHATGFNAPLYASPSDRLPELNVNDIILGWIKDGAAPEKLVMGLGFYGQSYRLAKSSENGVGAPTTQGGEQGEYTGQSGVLSYLEICKKIKSGGWTTVWDDKQQVPYAYNNDQWVGYDNVKSLNLKVDLAKKLELAGVMLWSIEQDDLRNICGEGHFPLLQALNKRIGRTVDDSAFVPDTNSESTQQPQQPQQPSTNPSDSEGSSFAGEPGDCVNGVAPDLQDCSYFIQCLSDGTKIRQQCAPGTLFDKKTSSCNFANQVKC